MAKAQGAVKNAAGGGAVGGKAEPIKVEWPVLSPVAFQMQYDAWLKANDSGKLGKLRELTGRIEAGDKKIGAALKAGTVTPEDDSYKAALAKLDGLKAERAELVKTAQVPHFAFAVVHNFLRASRGWNLPDGSKIEIKLPGVFGIAVDLSESEIPF